MRLSLLPARPRALAMLVVTALITGLLAVFAIVTPATAAADPVISLKADVTASVLSGANATVTLTATNQTAAGSGTNLYNIGYSYVLPKGVSIQGDATSDGQSIGAPTSTVTLTDGSTLIVFANVSDLVAGDQKAITFTVAADASTYPVGASFSGNAAVGANTDARTIPTFDTSTDPTKAGTPVAATTTNSASQAANTTDISAIQITKAEASPENELVRGVHDHPTTYTLTVTNTKTAATNGVTVTDYLPAGLEFLQCGGIDNTTSGPEYTGATTLNTSTTLPTATCPTPVSVTTVNDVAGQGSKVFTKVVWNLGDFAAGQTTTIKYLAAVPLYENTMTVKTGTNAAPAPTTAALAAAANLDNNNGPSTRQNGSSTVSNGQGQTNIATASGTYTGGLASGATALQSDTARLTVEAMDLAVAKSVTTTGADNTFVTGGTASYALHVRASEYESSAGITLVDTLPNGLCPKVPAGTTTTGAFPAACTPANNTGAVTATSNTDGSTVGVTVRNVAYDSATGTFATTFDLADMPRDGDVTIRYGALMRTTYSSSSQAGPTAAGDSFTNTVQMNATSTGERGDTGTQAVADDSAATIVSTKPSIDKQVLPRPTGTVGTATQCAAQTGYVDTTPTTPYTLGDVVCFRLSVHFPAGVQSHNATVTDMLPTNTTSGSTWTEGADWVRGDESTVPRSDLALTGTPSSTAATFAVGHAVDGATGTYVDGTKTTDLVLYVAAHISTQGSSSTTPDITANLMKFAQQNTAGKVTSLRDAVDYTVAGSPQAGITKHITRTGADEAGLATDVDPKYTTEGRLLEYTVSVTNTQGTGGGLPISDVTVWDALPAGIHCTTDGSTSDVVALQGQPTFTCVPKTAPGASSTYQDRDYLTWKLAGPIASGASTSFTYGVRVPQQAYAGTAYQNAASIVSFTTATTTGATQTWVPKPVAGVSAHANGATATQGDAPSADAQATVTVQPNTVSKTGGAVAGGTNRSGLQAVPGQGLSYTYTGTVPAHTSVGSAVLSDTLPAGIGTTSSTTWALTLPGGTSAAATRSTSDTDTSVTYGGQTFTFTGGATSNGSGAGALVFPTTFDNTGDTDQVFSVTVTGLRVSDGVSSGNAGTAAYTAKSLTNTATFSSTDPVTKAVSAPKQTVTVAVDAPKLTITKTHTPTGSISGTDTVTWTLKATNASTTTDARSVVIADCFPTTLTFTGSTPAEDPSSIAAGATTALACATGYTLHAWNVGTLAAGASASVTVTGTLGTSASATSSFDNYGKVLGSGLDTTYPSTPTSFVQQASVKDTVKVASPTITKTLTAPTWDATTGATSGTATTNPANSTALSVRAGDTGSYTVKVVVPANVALHDGLITDTLPAGVTANGTITASADNGVTATAAYTDGTQRTFTVQLSDIGTDIAQNVTVTITVPVQIGTGKTNGTTATNSATLTWDQVAGDTSTRQTLVSNSAVAKVVTPSLSIKKTVLDQTTTNAAVEPGQRFSYTVRVSDSGSPAYGTVVTDCLPAGVTVVPGTIGEQGVLGAATTSCPGGVITWPATTVTSVTASVHTFQVTLAPDSGLDGTAVTNTASTSTYASLSSGGDSYAGKNASATVTPAFPSVAVTKTNTTAGGLSYIGQPSSFQVQLTNSGSAAKSVSAQDTLPANWQYVAGSAQLTRGGTTSTIADPTIDGQQLTWSGLGGLANNESITLTYQAKPTAAVATAPGVGTAVTHTNHVVVTVTDPTDSTSYNGGKGSFVTYPKAADGSAGTDATADAVIGKADLSIAKTATSAKVVAGATTQKAWTIVVTNTAGDDAHGTTVVESPDLPTGATATPQTAGTGWTCSQDGRTWTCVNGAVVKAGASFEPLDITLTLPADAPLKAIDNTATIQQGPGQTYDGNPANDTADASVTPVAIADLAITKTAPDSVQAGLTATWQLSVRNITDASEQSLSDARGPVTVTDTLPDTVTLQSATTADGSGWTCTTDGNTVTCTREGLANGTTAPAITVTALVHADVVGGTKVTNEATVAVDRSTTDPTSSNDTSTVSSTTTDTTALTITKAFTGDTLVPGSPAEWTMHVTNAGPADARQVQVTDHLQGGTRLDGDQTSGAWTCTGTTDVTCDLTGTLKAGDSTDVTIRVTTPSDLSGTLQNEAQVTAANATAVTAQTSSAAKQHVTLGVTKVADVAQTDAGTDVTYTITVDDLEGPSDLPAGTDGPSILVQDTLPAGVQYVGASAATTAHWTVTEQDGVVTATSTDGIAAGTSDPNVIELVVHVPSSFGGSSIRNVVTATPVTAQQDGDAAFDDATVAITTHADLQVTKTRTSAPSADAGTEVTYDVTVHNAGPSDAQHATWTDTPPTGMTVTGVTTDDDGWEQGDDARTWSTDVLAAGATTTFHVTAAIGSGTADGTLTNTATVGSATPDTDPTNDTATADVQVTSHAQLTLTKTPVAKVGSTDAAVKVTAGAEQVWLVQVHNAGPSDERPDTVVTDDLPEGLTFVSASSDGAVWTCDATTDPSNVACTLPSTIVAGTDAPALWITTKLASGYTGDSIANRARITGQGTDPTPGTNAGDQTTPITVDEDANVAITIGHTGTAVIGTDLPETVQVRNAGLSDARDVTATYTLPKGLTYVSTEADPAWTVTSVTANPDGSTTVSFALTGPLVAGATAPVITVHQVPTAAAYPGVDPTATVATSTPETTLEDNTSDDVLGVAPASALSVTKTHTGQVVRGETVGYTITVRNSGPTEDPGPVVVTDALPTGLSFVSIDDGKAATCQTGSTLSCTLSEPLASGGKVAFQLTVKVASDAPDRITNVATVRSATTQVTPTDPTTVFPGDPLRASDPAPVHDDPAARGDLAFTGAVGLGTGALLALLAIALGAAFLVLRRRRRA